MFKNESGLALLCTVAGLAAGLPLRDRIGLGGLLICLGSGACFGVAVHGFVFGELRLRWGTSGARTVAGAAARWIAAGYLLVGVFAAYEGVR